MATNHYTENLRNSELSDRNIQQWFKTMGFEKAQFESNNPDVYVDGILHKVEAIYGYDTYLKVDIGGSILVFEVKLSHKTFDCIGYAPILHSDILTSN